MEKIINLPKQQSKPHCLNDSITINTERFFADEVKSYKLNMFRVANSILRNHADAEDAVSESILKAYTSLRTLKSLEKFKPWIMKILVRECYLIQKKKKKLDYYEDMQDIPAVVDNEYPELLAAVDQLSDEFRGIVILFYYEDMSIADIARTLGIPQGTVKSRLSRAKGKLKTLIEEGGTIYKRRISHD